MYMSRCLQLCLNNVIRLQLCFNCIPSGMFLIQIVLKQFVVTLGIVCKTIACKMFAEKCKELSQSFL